VRRDSTRGAALHAAFCASLAACAGLAFWLPALRATHGDWPAPLDDVFIHFDFARSAARGHPFSWIAGQGYSSGETSPLYAFVLSAGYAIGFRGYFLGVWAALVAVASVTVAMRSLREWTAPAPAWTAWVAAPMLVCVGVVDWSLYSGMEVALAVALLSRALVSAKRTQHAVPAARAGAQWALGLWGALLVWTRPEAAVIVAPLAVVAARAARSQSPWAALGRAGLPGALATVSVLGLNWVMTGDAQSAGARLKLLGNNPFYSDVDRARELVLNLFYFVWKSCADQLGASPRLAWLLPGLALCAVAERRSRDLAVAALSSCALYTLIVSFNGAARHQNFRYYAPALALLLFGATLGIAAIGRSRGRKAAPLLALIAVLSAASRAQSQVTFFTAASKNIHDQQVSIGAQLRVVTPEDAVILVGDAGAIPYFSHRRAIDALGLGGYFGLPLVVAAPHGEAATVELLQRLAPGDRPTHLALYPNWFPGITSAFGRELARVTIDDNVICGGPAKVIYSADFAALDGDRPPSGEVLDELDVADVISERAHAYVSAAPSGGWTTMSFHRGIFDAGRITPEGTSERFLLRRSQDETVLVMRTDDASNTATLIAGQARIALRAEPAGTGAWIELRARLPAGSDTVAIEATRGALRDFHVWVIAAR
jgi:hypothetical protein